MINVDISVSEKDCQTLQGNQSNYDGTLKNDLEHGTFYKLGNKICDII